MDQEIWEHQHLVSSRKEENKISALHNDDFFKIDDNATIHFYHEFTNNETLA